MTGLRRDHLVDDSIIDRLLGRHEEVPVAVGLDLILGLPAVLSDVRVEHLADEEYFLGLDLDVGRLALGAAEGLVDHYAGVGEGPPLAGCAGAEEEGAHGGGHAEADGGHVAGDVLHLFMFVSRIELVCARNGTKANQYF